MVVNERPILHRLAVRGIVRVRIGAVVKNRKGLKMKTVTLASISDGAAEELFASALGEVLRNIDDPNTAWKPKRRVTLTLDFTCDEERRAGAVEIACTTKMPGPRGVQVGVHFGKHLGKLAIVEAPRTGDLFEEPKPRLEAVPAGSAE